MKTLKKIFKNSKLSFNLNLKKKKILFQENILLIMRFLKYDLNSNNNKNQNLIMNFEYMNLIDLKFINYQKPETKFLIFY